ncbi:toll/interleukin-1 receptor domain-containing protein [Breznakia pachnodae]|uniref:SEFIR domain-containing protein n=1 Tax=Breznakia pachnodae TaxID=265178 RepID=A0ABU0E4M6_9FIRM|nr:TIR domain-containing protein [Breznakia pachnodae]MDQ0361863.1 hypothetical protein [Breznakia pachnodae]
MKKIENPIVFISYAWATPDYEEKVLLLATKLRGDGINAILDKWNLKEGHDTYSFMEQSVLDDSITNVLLLLDPVYEKKANIRVGGVGTETQIISSEIYSKVDQEKFIPVIMARNQDGTIPKPVYLKNLLHFDLSVVDKYDDEYIRLVKRLYGEEYYRTPELGTKPSWVEEDINMINVETNKYNILSEVNSSKVLQSKYKAFLDEISMSIVSLDFKDNDQLSYEKIIEDYDMTKSIRSNYLELLNYTPYIENGGRIISDFFESTYNELNHYSNSLQLNVQKSFIHELLIYTITILFKQNDFSAIGKILTRTYYDKYRNRYLRTYTMFYYYNENLDLAVSRVDGKNYYSGTASHWITNLDVSKCSKDEFVFSDIILYNAAVYIEKFENEFTWFPLTYAFGSNENIQTRMYFKKLISNEFLEELVEMFGYGSVDDFKNRFNEINEEISKELIQPTRFGNSFESAPLINYCIDYEMLGIRR